MMSVRHDTRLPAGSQMRVGALRLTNDMVKCGKTVLVVEDEVEILTLLTQLLTKAGYEVVASDNGEDAILKAKTSKPDVILMDIVMPGLNGFQATRAISRDPQTRSVPIIICTSKSQETDKIWGMRQGARDYIVKPISRDELIAKIVALG